MNVECWPSYLAWVGVKSLKDLFYRYPCTQGNNGNNRTNSSVPAVGRVDEGGCK